MSYKHLTINERFCIYQFKNSGIGVSIIALAPEQITNRNVERISIPLTSTIYRMIHRK